MVITPLVALWIAIAVGALVLLAELVHRRRIRRVAHLAFGPEGRPAAWTSIASPLRVFAATAATLDCSCWRPRIRRCGRRRRPGKRPDTC